MQKDTNRPALPQAGVAHVLVDDLESPELGLDDQHHLGVVRRLKSGDLITLGDGRGRWRGASVSIVAQGRRSKGVELNQLGQIFTESRLSPRIVIGFVVPSLDRASWAVQKMTELGVDEIHLLHSKYSSTRIEGLDGSGKEFQKLNRVMREAAMQSRSAYLPELVPVASFQEFVQYHSESILCTFGSGESLNPNSPVIVGPEGGFSEDELEMVPRHASLSGNILRSETAVVAASAFLTMTRFTLSHT